MTRGNQRELARAKNQKKQKELAKSKNSTEKSGASMEVRKQRDADIMRQKQAAAQAAKEAGAVGGATSSKDGKK